MFTYQKLREVATKHYPKEGGYCGVIALSLVAQVPFGKSRSILFKLGRKDRQGTVMGSLHRAIESFGNKVEDATFDLHMAGAVPKTLATAARTLPKDGIFLLYTRGHVSCVRDGVLEDWAAESKSRKRILAIYEVTPATIEEK